MDHYGLPLTRAEVKRRLLAGWPLVLFGLAIVGLSLACMPTIGANAIIGILSGLAMAFYFPLLWPSPTTLENRLQASFESNCDAMALQAIEDMVASGVSRERATEISMEIRQRHVSEYVR